MRACLTSCASTCTPMFSMVMEAQGVHSNVIVITVCTEHRVAKYLDLQAWDVASIISADAGRENVPLGAGI